MSQVFVKEATLKKEFFVTTAVNGKATSIVAELAFNGNKGLVSVSAKLTDQQITGDIDEDAGIIRQLGECIQKAIAEGMEMKALWSQNRVDPDQLEMNFPDENDGIVQTSETKTKKRKSE